MTVSAEASGFSTDRYTSEEFLAREIDRVFRRTWIVVARESDIPKPGDRLAVDEIGEALAVVRGADGVVRTFRNACRHRGTRLVSKPCNAKNIQCPYHGWTYGLDGRLLGVPSVEGFQGLDREALALSAIRTECWGGFVWITFDDHVQPVREYLGALADQLEPYKLEEMRPLHRHTSIQPCNWKAILDQATETYHLRAVHGQSISPHIKVLSKFDGFGPHHRQTIPIADYWWRPGLDRMSSPSNIPFTPDQLRLFHKYVIFPNTLVNVMPYHLTVFRVFPVSADTCRFHYEFHIRENAGAIAKARGWLTLAASLKILREDFALLTPFQAGGKSAGHQAIPFHHEERALAYFHGVVDKYLADVGGMN